MTKSPNRNKVRRLITAGIWEDMDGSLHFSLPDLLAAVELEDTQENREIATAMIKDLMADRTDQFIERATPED